ncbi:hypothetical protein E2557_11725 [Staphylococcus petrasii]|uniref:Tyr recombinase domain-containing protein n=1 Tax=Staphylococcus petrasii TaxID=1276936 RepID=A0ABY2KSM1_9STAP|nr:tyrosine-type recombinase/integrase [Staphylococcus petrasii]PNZ31453.1 hypothetical protein CD137_02930 [Staphylococcus petrasii]TGE10916.1 hypothetical protein E2557_11725 [Staphylococcus petrasii]TGE15141.1 hypothetical protein BJR09_11970 [Staphylococcus petrasii]
MYRVNDVFKIFSIKYQYPIYNIKSLCHPHCSYLLANGMSIQYISKRLGHADIQTTLKIYSHLIKEYELEEDKDVLTYLNKLMN